MTYEGPQQDIWSLGILLYTMIYKATPFNDYYEIIRKKIIFPQTISNGKLIKNKKDKYIHFIIIN